MRWCALSGTAPSSRKRSSTAVVVPNRYGTNASRKSTRAAGSTGIKTLGQRSGKSSSVKHSSTGANTAAGAQAAGQDKCVGTVTHRDVPSLWAWMMILCSCSSRLSTCTTVRGDKYRNSTSDENRGAGSDRGGGRQICTRYGPSWCCTATDPGGGVGTDNTAPPPSRQRVGAQRTWTRPLPYSQRCLPGTTRGAAAGAPL
jgi:hypothetical protein